MSVEGKVAIITGAGGGLGRQHALLLSSHGAKIVVNDLGGAIEGYGKGEEAEEGVEEIGAGEGAGVALTVTVPFMLFKIWG